MNFLGWTVFIAASVGFIAAVLYLLKFFRSDKKNVQNDPPGTVPLWPSNILIKTSVAATFLMALTIVSGTGFHLFDDPQRSDLPITLPPHLPEVFAIAIIVGLISFSLSNSSLTLIRNISFFIVPLVSSVWLILYQSAWSFWTTAAVMCFVVAAELNEQMVFKDWFISGSQIAVVYAFFVSLFVVVASKYLPELVSHGYVSSVIPILRFRTIAAAAFSVVVVTVLCVKTYQDFSYQATDLVSVNAENERLGLIYLAILTVINFMWKVGATVGAFFEAFWRELISFIRQVFNRAMWTTILYASGTIICFLGLAAEVVLIKRHLLTVMQNVSLFFNWNRALLFSNLLFGGAFIMAMIAILALVQIWLPRDATKEVRRATETRVVNGTAMICICIFVANFLYYPFLNFLFSLGDQNLSWPGVYTVVIIVLGIVITTLRRKKSDSSPSVADES